MVEKLRPSYTFTEDRLEQLKGVVPEAFADGKINWDVLREALGEYLEDEESERFGLFWPGKREARRLAAMPSKGTLVPVPGEGVNEETTRNIFIEGENLEVLKLLLKSYAGQVKVIYIDPPYNTGNDFIYSDDYSEPLQSYLSRTGQLGDQEELLTSNPRASGRFHSNWLNMIYPRLLLAREMLTSDGCILISIDDNEVHNLRMLIHDVFGEENFVGELVWQKKYTGGKHARHYVDMHEYVLCAAKSKDLVGEILMERPDDEKEKFVNEDEFVRTRGRYYIRPLKSNLAERPTLVYPIAMPDGSALETQWLVSEATFNELVEEGRIEIKQKRDGAYQVYKKYYENDGEGMVKVPSIIEGIYNTEAKMELKELFNIKEGRDNVLYTVKPTRLVRYLLEPFLKDSDIVMDFFAGSATTSQAVMEINLEKSSGHRYIVVQIPEPTDTEPFVSIAEIGKERIRRAIQKLAGEHTEIVDAEGEKRNLGFKVFKLTRSHLRGWQNYQGEEIREYQRTLGEVLKSPLVEGWKEEDVLTEIMLMQGFPLDSDISALPDLDSATVYKVQSGFHEFSLYVCLDEQISTGTAERLVNLPKEDVLICLDSALTDELKMKLDDAVKLHVI